MYRFVYDLGAARSTVLQTLGVLMCQAMFTAMGMLACPPVVTAVIAAHAAGGPTEADWIRWTGVIVGMIGVGVVAPAALALIWQQAAWIRDQPDRFLKWIYGGNKTVPIIQRVSAILPVGFNVSAEGAAGPAADADLAVLVHHLMKELDALRDRVTRVEQKQHADHESVKARMDQRDSEDRAARDALARRLEEDRLQDTRLNAKGLPLIALGILLSGVPDGLAAFSWVGWISVAVSGGLALWLGVWPFGLWLVRKVRRPPSQQPTVPAVGAAIRSKAG